MTYNVYGGTLNLTQRFTMQHSGVDLAVIKPVFLQCFDTVGYVI